MLISNDKMFSTYHLPFLRYCVFIHATERTQSSILPGLFFCLPLKPHKVKDAASFLHLLFPGSTQADATGQKSWEVREAALSARNSSYPRSLPDA